MEQEVVCVATFTIFLLTNKGFLKKPLELSVGITMRGRHHMWVFSFWQSVKIDENTHKCFFARMNQWMQSTDASYLLTFTKVRHGTIYLTSSNARRRFFFKKNHQKYICNNEKHSILF